MPRLFEDFDRVSSKQWKQQIQYEQKGADYNDLIWESPEGIKVKPFYHRDQDSLAAPVLRTKPGFLICQDIFVFDLEKSIARAKSSLKRGAESIRFIIQDPGMDVAKTVRELSDNDITLYFSLEFLSAQKISEIDAAAKDKPARIFVSVDPIHRLASDGNWFASKGQDNIDALSEIAKTVENINIVGVDATIYQNAGANIVQQIAYTLAHANEYFNIINFKGPVLFRVAIGSNYFFEIAKLRALRQLFNVIAKEYNLTGGCHILATPSKRNKTIYDYNVNMLRTTTECMSAILGGADSVCNLPYDALYHKSNEFGERISRNQLLVMKHESYFDKTANAADGSYYIESITQQLMVKSLELFKEIEKNGGFVKQLLSGTIQRKILESAAKEQAKFDEGAEVLIGTNKHPNKLDRMAGDMELFPFAKTNGHKMMITPIVESRLAEKLEQQRLESEKQTL